jgi:hypothetical protein
MTRLAVTLAFTIGAADLLLAQPTYYGDVSRIFREKCELCHRENDLAPFALADYETASTWARDIKRVVSQGKMPPWKPVAGHGEFKGSFALTEDERKMIIEWVDAEAPAGDEANKLPPLDNKSEWPLGYPDRVLSMLESYEPPIGQDEYRCFVIPTDFDETRYIRAIDYLPGDRGIVHHVLLYADTAGIGEKLDAQDPGPGYQCFGGPGISVSLNNLKSLLGGWAPGQRAHFLPDELGLEIPKGAKLIMQVHYFPVARTGPDQTRIGIYLHEKKPKNTMFMVPVLNDRFTVPVGAEAHKVNEVFPTGSLATLFDLLQAVEPTKVHSVYPHMHLLGQQIQVELTNRAGETIQPLIYIDNWDFNWQGSYDYVKPVEIKSGNRVKLTCTYNNSESNFRNPNNPIIPVGWGEKTTDEMCLVFLGVYSTVLENTLGALN